MKSNVYVSVSYINCGIRKQLTFSWTVHAVRSMHQKCHLIYQYTARCKCMCSERSVISITRTGGVESVISENYHRIKIGKDVYFVATFIVEWQY